MIPDMIRNTHGYHPEYVCFIMDSFEHESLRPMPTAVWDGFQVIIRWSG